eukprot:ANDGO_01843.mRNA.1 hypothetical protein
MRAILWLEAFYVCLSIVLGLLYVSSASTSQGSALVMTTDGCWGAFNLVTESASIGLLLIYLAPNASIYRFIMTKHPGNYNRRKHLWLPVASIVTGTGYIVAQFFPPPTATQGVCLAVLAVYLGIGAVVVARAKLPHIHTHTDGDGVEHQEDLFLRMTSRACVRIPRRAIEDRVRVRNAFQKSRARTVFGK